MQTWVKNLDTGEYVCLDDDDDVAGDASPPQVDPVSEEGPLRPLKEGEERS